MLLVWPLFYLCISDRGFLSGFSVLVVHSAYRGIIEGCGWTDDEIEKENEETQKISSKTFAKHSIHTASPYELFFPAGNTIAMKTDDLCEICRYAKELFVDRISLIFIMAEIVPV